MTFDLWKPNLQKTIDHNVLKQKTNHDRNTRHKEFVPGDAVWVLNPSGKGFKKGKILVKTGKFSYKIEVEGRGRRVHADQLKAAP